MIGKNDKAENIQFLIIGTSPGHIHSVIDAYPNNQYVFFTSSSMEQEAMDFLDDLIEKYQIHGDLSILHPFEQDSLFEMTKMIINKGKEYPENGIVTGVTGGTNLMAIAMAVASLTQGWKCHYVSKGSGTGKDTIMEIEMFQELYAEFDLEKLSEYYFAGGD